MNRQISRKYNVGRKHGRGFSLVELLVVIILLGVIMSIVLPQVTGASNSGKYKGAKNQLIRLGQAVETFYFDVGRYPQSLNELAEKPGDAEFWSGPYVQKSLLNDPWGNEWKFSVPGEQAEFDILTYAMDGSPGGDGYAKDLSNWD